MMNTGRARATLEKDHALNTFNIETIHNDNNDNETTTKFPAIFMPHHKHTLLTFLFFAFPPFIIKSYYSISTSKSLHNN